MSYAFASDLQGAIYAHLLADPGVQGVLGTDVYDTLPSGTLPAVYALIGEERVRDASDISADGAWHDLTVSVFAPSGGFTQAKAAAGAIGTALIDASPALSAGHVVALSFRTARALRESGGGRRIDLTFRARTDAA